MTIVMQRFERPVSQYRVKMKADGNKLGSGTLHITRSLLPRSEADTNARVVFERKGKIEFQITAYQLGWMRTEKRHDMKFDWTERGADGAERKYTAEVNVQSADGRRPEASQLHRDLFMARYVFAGHSYMDRGWVSDNPPDDERVWMANIWFKDGKLSVPWMDGLKTRYADIVGKEHEGKWDRNDDPYYLYLLDVIEDRIHDSGLKGTVNKDFPWSDNLVNWKLVSEICPRDNNDYAHCVLSQAIVEILRSNVIIGIGERGPDEILRRRIIENMLDDDWMNVAEGNGYGPDYLSTRRSTARFRETLGQAFPAFDWGGLAIHGRTVADLEHYEMLRMLDARISDGDFTHFNGMYTTEAIARSVRSEIMYMRHIANLAGVWWAEFLTAYNGLRASHPGVADPEDARCTYVPSNRSDWGEYHSYRIPRDESWNKVRERLDGIRTGLRRSAEIIESEAATFTYRRQVHDRSMELAKFFVQNRGAYRQKDGTILMSVIDGFNPPSNLRSAVNDALADIRRYGEGIEQDIPY